MAGPRGLMHLCTLKKLGAPGECRFRADGRPDVAHWVPRQRIRIALETRGRKSDYARAAMDSRVTTFACRYHHGMFDNKHWRLMREEQYPQGLRDWAEQWGFYWSGPRDGWRAEHQKEAA